MRHALLMDRKIWWGFLASLGILSMVGAVPVVVVTAKELSAEESARLEARSATVLAKGADLEERLHRTLDGIRRKRRGV